MKELYETPTVEFIEFDSEEVITMSTGTGTGTDTGLDNLIDSNNTGWGA